MSTASIPDDLLLRERFTDIKPPLFDLLDFTPVGLRVSAWYGEGGVRFIASPPELPPVVARFC